MLKVAKLCKKLWNYAKNGQIILKFTNKCKKLKNDVKNNQIMQTIKIRQKWLN